MGPWRMASGRRSTPILRLPPGMRPGRRSGGRRDCNGDATLGPGVGVTESGRRPGLLRTRRSGRRRGRSGWVSSRGEGIAFSTCSAIASRSMLSSETSGRSARSSRACLIISSLVSGRSSDRSVMPLTVPTPSINRGRHPRRRGISSLPRSIAAPPSRPRSRRRWRIRSRRMPLRSANGQLPTATSPPTRGG